MVNEVFCWWLLLGTGELIDSGGVVEFFNPTSSRKGFGYGGVNSEKMDFLAFRGATSSHAYVPPPIKGGPGAGYIAVSGAAGILQGADNLLPMLLGTTEEFAKHRAAIHLKAGEISVNTHRVVVGDGSLSTLTETIWAGRGVALKTLQGQATDDKGKAVVGARLSVLQDGRAITQVVSGPDGKFKLAVPAKPKLAMLGWHHGLGLTKEVPVSGAEPIKIQFGGGGALSLTVRDGDGNPQPAKVTVLCESDCQPVPQTVRDAAGDRVGESAHVVTFTGVDGKIDQPLPVGVHKVLVSAGPTRSLWPPDFATAGGKSVTIQYGKTVALEAVVRQAVDTSGWLSGDFHVHQVNSPDAPVSNRARVRSFMAEGVDVLVPTDHDYITDMQPFIDAEKASDRLVSLPGIELTTFDYGHFNAFPLKVDAKDLTGGAIDWGGGAGPGMDPPEIAAALSKHGTVAAPVVQINHPGFGYLRLIKADVLGGISYAERSQFRLSDKPKDPKTGDTGLFSEDFTAIELMTGHRGGGGFGGDSFTTCASWWFTLLSRGVHWTGTATSDTHRLFSSQNGGPRTWVRVGAGKDTAKTFDAAHFAAAVNAGRAVGSEGPFVRMWAEQGGNKAAIGDTLAVQPGATVTVTVDLQAPAWMDLQRVELYVAPTNTVTPVGVQPKGLPPPDHKVSLSPTDADLVAGVDPKTKRWHLQATFELQLTADSYVVAMVYGDKKMPPELFAGREVLPFAFTNPLYFDADKGGYNHPPLKKKIQPYQPPPPPLGQGAAGSGASAGSGSAGFAGRGSAAAVRRLTLSDVRRVIEAIEHH